VVVGRAAGREEGNPPCLWRGWSVDSEDRPPMAENRVDDDRLFG
jgi:hypothetical protein